MDNLSAVGNLVSETVLNRFDISQPSLQGRSILYVEDEYVNFLYFSELLSGTGAKILRAYSYYQALTYIALEYQLCLVMISESFVKGTNYHIVSQIKNIEPSVPIIGILGIDTNEGTHNYLEMGCDLYINRHIDNIQLIEIVNELITSSDTKL